MKEPSEIWYPLYDKGINQGVKDFNEKQTLLYTYIDLQYSIEMSGLDGFIYNISAIENGMAPYIRTLEYFGLKELASSFLALSDAFKKANDGREETWDDFIERTGTFETIRSLDRTILDTITEKYLNAWILQHWKELSQSL